MDIETTAAIERLTERVDALEATMQAGFGSVRAELRSEVGGVRAEVGELRAELRSEAGSVRAELGGLRGEVGELRDGQADNRRHTQVLFESLQHDIRIVAEGVATLSAKFDARPQ